jgi:hypothetical protein
MHLEALGFPDYPAYLRSPHWKAKRADYRCSSQPQECICGETESLQLHHMTYDRIGDEALTDLTPLCGSCHNMIHELERRGDIGLDLTGFVNEERAKRHQAEQAAKQDVLDAEAASEQKQREKLPLDVRMSAAMKRAERNRLWTDVSKDFRAIARRLTEIERKLDRAERGTPQ